MVTLVPSIAQTGDGALKITDPDQVYEAWGRWHFTARDEPEFKEVDADTSDWGFISTQDTWIFEDIEHTGKGWYRLNLYFEDLSSPPHLSIAFPFHYNYLEIYFNGQKINRLPPEFQSNPSPRPPLLVSIPDHLIRLDGKNVIALRTSAMDGLGGFRSNFLKIGPHDKIVQSFATHLIYNTMLGVIPIAFSVYFLFFYLQRKDELYYLYFSILGLFSGLWILGFKGLTLFLIQSQLSEAFFAFGSGVLMNAFSIHFIHSFYRLKYGIIAWTLFIVTYSIAIIIVLEYTITGSILHSNTYLLQPFLALMLAYPIYLLYLNLAPLLNKFPFADFIFTGSLIYATLSLLSILGLLAIFPIEPMLNEGFFIMTLIFASVLSRRFSRMHSDLEKAHDKLLSLDKLKDEFLAITSHELRTPLSGIIGLAESTMDIAHKPDAVKRNVNLIASSGKRLSYLVDDILDFSRLKSADLEIQIKAVNSGEIAELVSAISRPLIQQKGLEMKLDFANDLPPVAADENRLQQILLNLVGNAIKFTHEGSIILKGEKTASGVQFSVIDTGIGIPADKQNEIFESFVQGDGTVTRKYGGAGLGLSIVTSLLRLHNSTIRLRSKPNQGSEFSFELPAAYPGLSVASLQIAESYASPFSGLSSSIHDLDKNSSRNNGNKPRYPHTILIVDDDPLIIQLMQTFLKNGGFAVQHTTDAIHSLDLVREIQPDMVIMDLMMPEVSGLEICKELRSHYPHVELPILIVSANTSYSEKDKAFDAGANDYLTKPINKNDLISRVKLHLNL